MGRCEEGEAEAACLAHRHGATGARHRLLQEWVTLAVVLAPLIVWEVPRGASKLPSRAQLTASLGTAAPSRAIFCLGVLELLSGPPASKTSHCGLFWGVPRGQVLGRALKPAFGLSPRHVQGSLSSGSGERTEPGLSTAFSQSGSVTTVTKEVAKWKD